MENLTCCHRPYAPTSPAHHTVAVGTKFDIEFDYDFGLEERSFFLKTGDESSSEQYHDALSFVENNQSHRLKEKEQQQQHEQRQRQQQEKHRTLQQREEKERAECVARARLANEKLQARRKAQQEREQSARGSAIAEQDENRNPKTNRIPFSTINIHNAAEESVEVEASEELFSVSLKQSSSESGSNGRPPLGRSQSMGGDTGRKLKQTQKQLKMAQRELQDNQNELHEIRYKAQIVRDQLTTFKGQWGAQQDALANKEKELKQLRTELLEKTNQLSEQSIQLEQTKLALEDSHAGRQRSKKVLALRFEELQKCQKELDATKNELSDIKVQLSRTCLQLECTQERRKQFSSKALQILKGETKVQDAPRKSTTNTYKPICTERPLPLARSKSCVNLRPMAESISPATPDKQTRHSSPSKRNRIEDKTEIIHYSGSKTVTGTVKAQSTYRQPKNHLHNHEETVDSITGIEGTSSTMSSTSFTSGNKTENRNNNIEDECSQWSEISTLDDAETFRAAPFKSSTYVTPSHSSDSLALSTVRKEDPQTLRSSVQLETLKTNRIDTAKSLLSNIQFLARSVGKLPESVHTCDSISSTTIITTLSVKGFLLSVAAIVVVLYMMGKIGIGSQQHEHLRCMTDPAALLVVTILSVSVSVVVPLVVHKKS